MALPPPSDHFRGKSVIDHLREAKAKGMHASHEAHGAEVPGHFAAGADAAKETAVILLILWTLSFACSFSLLIIFPQILWLYTFHSVRVFLESGGVGSPNAPPR